MGTPLDDLKAAKAGLEEAMRSLDQFVKNSTGEVIGPLATKTRDHLKPAYEKVKRILDEHLGAKKSAEVEEPNLAHDTLPTDEGKL